MINDRSLIAGMVQQEVNTGYTTKYIYAAHVCPLVRIGTPTPPLQQASVSLPPNPAEPKGEGHTRLRVRRRWGVVGVGSLNSDDWRKSLVLSLPTVYSVIGALPYTGCPRPQGDDTFPPSSTRSEGR